ncbi:hypothetical protein KVT40_001428 [Elsinoe batatas]|uniref:Mitochondrial carrier n=1 Tax=Elsinoe batatas TaxID=2601811 RepID=A0A8K0L502_9PEZI|nr:hypothetical protein KVT40_001428 [Elsinoe batatas]
MATSKPSNRLDNLIAGGAAGLLESFTTYPTEYVKTRQQLASKSASSISPVKVLIDTLRRPNGFAALYRGAGAFCSANAAKSGVRFFAFDSMKIVLVRNTKDGKSTATANLVSGLVAGVAESVLVVTPGETLKTKLIDDADRQGGARFRGSFDAIRQVLASEGPSGLYKGVVPVTLKQSSNAMVRFTTYGFFSDALERVLPLGSLGCKPVLAGASAGVVTVYATMPFDTIKTRLQSLSSVKGAQGTLGCCAQIIRHEGFLALWRGATPRLVRLTVSGAISFSVYENMKRLLVDLRGVGESISVPDKAYTA